MPVSSPAHLGRLWRGLMGRRGFGERGLWLVVLDHADQPSDLVVPITDLPDEPEPDVLRALVTIVEALLADGSVGAVPMLLTRGGGPALTAADRRWARALHAQLGPAQAGWPLHLATEGAVTAFAAEDLRAAG